MQTTIPLTELIYLVARLNLQQEFQTDVFLCRNKLQIIFDNTSEDLDIYLINFRESTVLSQPCPNRLVFQVRQGRVVTFRIGVWVDYLFGNMEKATFNIGLIDDLAHFQQNLV